MSDVTLSDSFFSKIGGWEAMKQARAILREGRVLSSKWEPPLLQGIVQAGEIAYKAGLLIKSERDIENLCPCRQSRQWGTICAHAVAVGLHWLQDTSSRSKSEPGKSEEAQGARPEKLALSTPGDTSPGTFLKLARPGESGEPAELFFILPPNLEAALNKGRLMICFEALVAGKRAPLNALPLNVTYAFDTRDTALLERLEKISGGLIPAMMTISTKDFFSWLELWIDHPRLSLGKGRVLQVRSEPWAPAMNARLDANGEILLRLRAPAQKPVFLGGRWVLREDCVQPFGLPERCAEIFQKPVRLTRNEVPFFLNVEWPRLLATGGLEADFDLDRFVLETRPPNMRLELEGGLAMLRAKLRAVYGSHTIDLGVPSTLAVALFLPDPDHPMRYFTRDPAFEQNAVNRLNRAGFKGPDPDGIWHLRDREAVLAFFARDYPRMDREWNVCLEERLQHSTERNLERLEPRFAFTSSGTQWVDLNVAYQSSGGEVLSPAEVHRLLRSGQRHSQLRNGKTLLIDADAIEELQDVLRDCSPEQQADGYRMKVTQRPFLQSTIQQQGWKVFGTGSDSACGSTGSGKPVCPPLGALESVLRPYQKEGVAWLSFLRAHQFGGILADEMGLGKTLQALAYFQSIAGGVTPATAASSGLPGGRRSLVVCPTSLVSNWVAEAKRFVPSLRVLPLHGPERGRWFAALDQFDLIITTYHSIRLDADRYRDWEFDTVLLDEAQHIKNRQTQNAQAVKAIKSGHRLVLTGTPLENSVLDLWSIFDFLMPGYLGSARDFRERYELPITRDRDARAQERLSRRVRPFLLRRLKQEVARDLPEKIEQVAYCELTEPQRTAYRQLMEASRREIMEAVGDAQGAGRQRMMVLNALLRLRQVCCDLRLLRPEHVEAATASGKLELFDELLEEIIDGGHRVLVFSQFVTMLQLVRKHLEQEGLNYCYLDGSTKDRAAVVERFQKNSSIPVFLISLKAGGVGLNLTGADTVIHFDPWWNPAVEAQATDRSHRIGQTRVVTSYKLIARDTIEEKILTLQTRKKEILASTLGTEEALADSLTWEEIQDLLRT